MTARTGLPRILRHQGDDGWWEMALGQPDPRLRAYVQEYQGYAERTAQPLRRRHFANSHVVLIIDFGPTLRLLDPRDEARSAAHGVGFVAGLHDTYAVTETAGAQSGIQVNFTPIGARLFFGLPMNALSNRVVGLDEIFDAEGRRAALRLQEAPDWEARFAMLDGLIATRIGKAPALPPGVVRAWQRLDQTRGRLDIGALAGEIGWSRKHLIAQFHSHIGLPPKLLARILRFDSALRLLDRDEPAGWAEIACRAGYYDQAHLIRDFRQFAGGTPGDVLRRRLPDNGGVIGD